MSIEVEGPDGAINEFPDGTPDAVISKAMRQQYGGPSGETTAPAQPGIVSRVEDAVAGALGRAGQTIADTTGIGRKKPSVLQSESDLDAMVRGVAPAPVSKPQVEGGTRREGLAAGLFGVADQGVRGLAQGAATIAGMPVDLATMLVNLTPGVQQGRQALGLSPTISRPFLGSEFNKDALDTANDATIGAINSATGANLDLPVREGDNAIERITNRVGQEMGATALPVAGAIGKAAQVGMEGARAMHPTLGYFVEQAAANPARFAAKELSTAGAAGIGAGAVNEVSRAAGADPHSAGYVAGDLAGALLGAGGLGVSQKILGTGRDIVSALTNNAGFVSQTARDAAVDRIAEAAGAPTVSVGKTDAYDVGPLARQIDEARQTSIGDTVPGYQDTLADTTKNPGIAQLEYSRGAAGSKALVQRGAENEGAVNRAIDAQAPEGATDALRTALAGRRSEMRDEVAQAVVAARGRENAALDAVRPRMTPDVRGAEIRRPLRGAADAAKAEERAAYAGINEGEVPAEPLADAFAAQRQGLSEARRVRMDPTEITSIPGRHVPEPEAPPAPAPEPAGMAGMTAEEQAMARRLMENRPFSRFENVERANGGRTIRPAGVAEDGTANSNGLNYTEHPDRISIDGSYLAEHARGQGLGEGMYRELADLAQSKGKPVYSDFDVSADAHRVYEKLRTQGYDVEYAPGAAFDTDGNRAGFRGKFTGGPDDSFTIRINPRRAPEPELATMPLREVADMRSALRTDHRNALSAGDTNKAAVAQGYIDRIDAFLAEHHPNPEGYEDARALSVDYNNRFNRPTTDVAQILRENQGLPVVPDASVAPRFARPNTGDQRGLTDLLREAPGAGPREAVADQLRAQADGLRTPEAVRTFIAEHSQALERFPALRDQLAERAGAQGYREGQEARSAATDRLYGTENTRGSTAVGRYLHYGPEQSRAAIKGVLNDAKPAEAARELFDFANRSPEAIAGMRRGLWEEMAATSRRKGETTRGVASGEQPWMPEAASKFLNDPKTRAVLQEAYRDNPEHLASLDRLFEVLQGANTGARGRVGNTSGTPQALTDVVKSVISPERISSDIRTVKRGQMSYAFAGTAIASTIARKAVAKAQSGAIDRMVDAALTNPEAAAALLRENNPVNRAYLQRNSKLWFGDHADRVMSAVNDNADPDPVKEALRRSRR